MSVNDQYALNWSNHTSHIRKAFDTLLSENQFVDVTLSCEGKKVVAHKIILSACSTYFHDLFRDNPCQHPIVILKDVKFQNLMDILKFIYNGEVSVSSDNFDSFLKTAELLQISGLTDDDSKQLDEASSAIESNETPTLETTSINLKSAPQPSPSTSTAVTHRVKSPVSKKRPMEVPLSEELTTQKKKKESVLDIEIKEEISESNFEEDEINSIIDIKDPLQLEQQQEEADLSETLPVVNMDSDSKKRVKRSSITKRPSLPKEVLEEAVKTVLDKKMSIRGAARQFNMAKSVLARFVVKAKSEPDRSFIYEPRNRNKILTCKEEDNLIGCLTLISETTQILTYQKIREFAFHYAVRLGKEGLPKNWIVQQKAGMDWTKLLMKRHQDLLIQHQKDKFIYEPGDFVVVKTESAGYALGEVIQILTHKKIFVKFLEKLVDSYRFVYPEYDDVVSIDISDIYLKLTRPEIDDSGTDKSILSFNFDLSDFL